MSRPSAGLVFLVAVAIASTAFFAWGWRTPALEKVWRMDLELGMASRPALSRGEMRLLQHNLTRHPDLADFLIEDKHAGIFSANERGRVDGRYAYLVRPSADSPGRLEILYEGSDPRGAVNIESRTLGSRSEGICHADAPFVWQLSDDGPFPQLVEILISKAKRQKTDDKERRHPVSIHLRGAD